MITNVTIGNIFEADAQTLVNTVNCVGIMGKGIAADFKKRFPDMFADYKSRCDNGLLRPGEPYIYKSTIKPWIINFPTKNHWRSVSKLQDIEKGVDIILEKYREWEVTSLAVPPLGCGNGQLEWRDVGPLLYRKFQDIDIPVELYASFQTPKEQLSVEFLKSANPKQSGNGYRKAGQSFKPEWLVLIEILYQIGKNPYHRPIGRTFFQKIGYIATAQGVNTGFQYSEGSFGPFSHDIKHAIAVMSNNNLLIEKNNGQGFQYLPGEAYSKMREKHKDLIDRYKKVIDRTTDLFMRMDTNQAEIVSTILFSSRRLKEHADSIEVSEKEIFDRVMDWKKKRRPPLKEEDVASAIRNLVMLRWLNAKFSQDLPVSEMF
ncbi:macro domain-containing protein [bacterium]|nr:macro domain-containing protein [bacterium]MBU1064842.1 macro domain-containing protein [bacterium]MBU1635309.1 macro domain-containing protein [bacterium]MBU1873308.1 macro domain-containing protein [bacterium]